MPSIAPDCTHFADHQKIVIAIIRDNNKILICRRSKDKHQGGKWEFPGGKCEPGETTTAALQREISEEIGVQLHSFRHLISLPYIYQAQIPVKLLLMVYQIDSFSGSASGREDQEIRWIDISDLSDYNFPAANHGIIQAIKLQRYYLILTDEHLQQEVNLESVLKQGKCLFQFRLKSDRIELLKLQTCITQMMDYPVDILFNSTTLKIIGQLDSEFIPELKNRLIHSPVKIGCHLTAQELGSSKFIESIRKQLHGLIAASCHNLEQIHQANRQKIDFMVLSPVMKTSSHPHAETLGWSKFSDLTDYAQIPVYALGGMMPEHLQQAMDCGAQGIAGISFLQKLRTAKSEK